MEAIAARDGTPLALHAFGPAEPAAVLFYVHGTQSHAGWLFETGPTLAERGVAVYALDRRGSGASGGPAGDTPSFRAWLDDYAVALERVCDRHPRTPLTLLGQSMGGCIAAALAAESDRHDALLLSAPAFDLLSARVPAEKRAALLRERPLTPYPVKVTNEQYTRDPERLAFMARDERMTRALTGRFLAAQIELEEHLGRLPAGCLAGPALLVVGREDSIVQLPLVRLRFAALAAGGEVVELPTDEHYLEFSGARAAWWDVVAGFALRARGR